MICTSEGQTRDDDRPPRSGLLEPFVAPDVLFIQPRWVAQMNGAIRTLLRKADRIPEKVLRSLGRRIWSSRPYASGPSVRGSTSGCSGCEVCSKGWRTSYVSLNELNTGEAVLVQLSV